jgi:excisionase family DNA binding protein
LSAEELLGQPTLRPTQRIDDPAAADSDAPLLVDAVTAANLLGIGRTTLDELVREGKVRRVKLAGRVLFSIEHLRTIAGGEA